MVIEELSTLMSLTSCVMNFGELNTLDQDKVRRHNLLDFYNKQQLCDVKLMVEGRAIYAHKVELAANSDFFKAMFCGSFPEADQGVITLPCLAYRETELLLRYFYGESDILQDDTINISSLGSLENLLSAANFLQVPSVVWRVISVLKAKVNETNCFDMLKIANLYSCSELEEKCLEYINSKLKNCFEDVSLKNILKEPVSLIEMLVSSKCLQAAEDTLFDMLLSWTSYDLDERITYAEDLLKHIHVTLLSTQLIERGLIVFSSEPECVQKLQDCLDARHNEYPALNIDSTPEFRSHPMPFVLKREVETVQSLSNKLHFEHTIAADVEIDYEVHHGPAFHKSLLKNQESGDRLLVARRNIEIALETVGSFSGERSYPLKTSFEEEPQVLKIHAVVPRNKSNTYFYWLPVGETVQLYRHAAYVTANNFIFAAGGEKVVLTQDGYCLRTVADFHVLDPRTMIWKKLPPMKFSRSRFALVFNEQDIYAIGGRKGTFSCELHVEKFSLTSYSWNTCAELETGVFENIACFFKDETTIFTCYWKTTMDLLLATGNLNKVNGPMEESINILAFNTETMKFKKCVLQGSSLKEMPSMNSMAFFNNFMYLFQGSKVVRCHVDTNTFTSTGVWNFPHDKNYGHGMFFRFHNAGNMEFPSIQGQTRSAFGVGSNPDRVCFFRNVQSLDQVNLHPDDCRQGSCTVHDLFCCHHCAVYDVGLFESAFNSPVNDPENVHIDPTASYPFFHDEKSISYCGFVAFTRDVESKANQLFDYDYPGLGSHKCKKVFWEGFMEGDEVEDYDEDDGDQDFDDMFMWMA